VTSTLLLPVSGYELRSSSGGSERLATQPDVSGSYQWIWKDNNYSCGIQLLFITYHLGLDVSKFTTEVAQEYVKNFLGMQYPGRDVGPLLAAVNETYFTGGDSSEANQLAFIDLIGDMYFALPTLSTALLHSGENSIYQSMLNNVLNYYSITFQTRHNIYIVLYFVLRRLCIIIFFHNFEFIWAVNLILDNMYLCL